MKSNNRPLWAHLSLFFASAFWGLMAPLGKDAMTQGLAVLLVCLGVWLVTKSRSRADMERQLKGNPK